MSSVSSWQTSSQTEDPLREQEWRLLVEQWQLETSLSAQRWKLQAEITRLIDSKIDSKEKELLLRTKKATYNGVVDKLQPYQRCVNPMDRFPVEILEIIILDYIGYWHSFEQYLEKRVELLLPLTMASRQWRNYIHSAPILWDCIVVRGNRGDAVAHVVRGLKLSGDRPLTVILEVWPSLWKKIHPYFLGHRDRIMTFIPLMGDAEPGEGDIRVDGIDMIRDLAPLPNLRTVNGDLGYSNIKDTVKGIFNQSHSLECLKNFSFDPESLLEAQRNIALQEFHTYEELASLLSVLEKMPSIRKVGLFTMGAQTSSPTQESLSPSFRSVKPFNWTYLHCTQRLPLASLFHRLPHLTFLHVMSTIDELKEITISLHKLQSLRELIIHITSVHGASPSLVGPISPVKPNHTIRLLEITCTEFDMSRKEREFIALIVFKMLSQAAPAIENLVFFGRSTVLSGWELDAYAKLEKLTIRNTEVGMNVHIPNSIQTLLIESAGLLKRLIASPNIRNLEVRLLVWRADFMVTKTQDAFMDLTEWPALEVATLQSNYSRLVGTSFSSLRKITLKSLPYFTKFDTNITLFIKEIAEVVDRYPCLEEIYMDECPEWDILVIMLERRNILAVPIIKPIRRLSLPSTCPSSVSQLLPGLLAGKWVQRPSNFELSQAGNAKNILNSAKSGCFACLRILRKCDTPLKAADPADYGDEFMSKMQDYPHSEDEILATWQKRTELWEYVYKLEGRLTRCNTQETCKLMKTFDAGSSPLISLPRENQPQTGMPSTRVDSADSASPIPPLAAEYLSQTSMPSILIDSTDFPSPSRSSLFTRLKKLGKSTMKPFKGD